MAEWADFWGESEWGGAISLVTTHEEDAINRLKFHLDGKANAESTVEVFAERWQILENFLSDLLTLIGLDASFGDVQDKLGSLLNVRRSGFDDDFYRVLLQAKALILIPRRRTVEGILQLSRALLGPKTLSSLEPFAFEPDMSTLTDRISAALGTADGTSYVDDLDARVFDGSTDRIDWPSIFAADGQPLTMSMRITPDTVAPAFQTLLNINRLTATDDSFFTLSGAVLRYVSRRAVTALDRSSAVALVVGTECHVVVTTDGSDTATEIKFYIDGFETAYGATVNGVGASNDGAGNWNLGGREQDDTRNFDGQIRDVLVWDRVLTATEVLTLFQGGKRFIDYVESYPKAFVLTLEGLTTAEEITFREFLRVARPATYNGVVLVIPDPAFGYDDATATISTDVLGFDDATGAVVAGGPYGHVLVL